MIMEFLATLFMLFSITYAGYNICTITDNIGD